MTSTLKEILQFNKILTPEIFTQQQNLSAVLEQIDQSKQQKNRNHLHNSLLLLTIELNELETQNNSEKDQKIQQYIEKISQQKKQLTQINSKLQKIQKRVDKVETTYLKLKEAKEKQ